MSVRLYGDLRIGINTLQLNLWKADTLGAGLKSVIDVLSLPWRLASKLCPSVFRSLRGKHIALSDMANLFLLFFLILGCGNHPMWTVLDKVPPAQIDKQTETISRCTLWPLQGPLSLLDQTIGKGVWLGSSRISNLKLTLWTIVNGQNWQNKGADRLNNKCWKLATIFTCGFIVCLLSELHNSV